MGTLDQERLTLRHQLHFDMGWREFRNEDELQVEQASLTPTAMKRTITSSEFFHDGVTHSPQFPKGVDRQDKKRSKARYGTLSISDVREGGT